MDKKKIILIVQGGAGDILAHTPMIRGFRRKYPNDELVVASVYSQLLENNPHIDRVIALNSIEEFYSQEILGCDHIRFVKKHFVYDGIYDEEAFGCGCLPEFICNMYDIAYDGEKLDYVISEKESKIVNTFIDQYRKVAKLPIVLLHCTGSIASDGNMSKSNSLKDLEINKVKDLVAKMKDKAIFIQIGLNGEPVVEGAIDALGMPMREAIALIPLADTFIFIESLFAHCSNALGKPGIVIFQNTDAKFFGYKENRNLSFSGGCGIWPCNRPVGALFDMLPGYRNPKTRQKLLWECPDQVCAKMPVEKIMEALTDLLSPQNKSLEAARKIQPPQLATKELEAPQTAQLVEENK